MKYEYRISAYNFGTATSPTEDWIWLIICADSEKDALEEAKKAVTRTIYKIDSIKSLAF